MISPTGIDIRIDTQGSGLYGSNRGIRSHKGVDFECKPGQNIYSPINGKIERIAIPYINNDKYSGVVIKNNKVSIKMFYFNKIEVKSCGVMAMIGNFM